MGKEVTRDDMLILNVPTPVPFSETLADQHKAQSGKSRAEIAAALANGTLQVGTDEDGEPIYAQKPEAMFDPETAVAPGHNWVNRGLYYSCEGAGHPNHRSMKSKSRPRNEHHVSRWLK